MSTGFLNLIRMKRGSLPNTFVTLSLTERMGNMLPIAYGGCALALAVQAAYHTLPSTGHYLGPTATDRHIKLVVEDVRTTRTFATRRVVLSQLQDDGSERSSLAVTLDFMLSAPTSFLTFNLPMPTITPHADLPPFHEALDARVAAKTIHPKVVDQFKSLFGLMFRFLDIKIPEGELLGQNAWGIDTKVPTSQDHLALTEKRSRTWLRSNVDFSSVPPPSGSDEALPISATSASAALLAFGLDGALSFIPLSFSHKFLQDVGACSTLDFALRIHSDKLDASQWHLEEFKTITGDHGRSYSEGHLWSEDGKLVATMSQVDECCAATPLKKVESPCSSPAHNAMVSSLPKPAAPAKRPRSEAASAVPETVREITALAAKLPPSAPVNADLNPLADLVALFEALPTTLPTSTSIQAKETNRQAVHTALHALKAVFESLISHGRIHGVLKGKGTKEGDQAAKSVEAVKVWLRERWVSYVSKAAEVAGAHWDAGVRLSALNALMSLVRTEAAFLTSLHPTRASQWPSATFALVVKGLLLPTGNGELLEDTKQEWMKWWDRYDDVRYHFLKEAAALASSHASASSAPIPPHLAANLLTILESLNSFPTVASEIDEWWCSPPVASKAANSISGLNGKPSKKRKLNSTAPAVVDDGSTGVFDSSSDEDEDENASKPKLSAKDRKRLLPPLLTLQAHRRAFQDCWLGLLSLPLDEGEAKRVLVILHRQVLPHMTDPKRTMDWLVDSTNSGGTIGILALNGLFTLMTKHNLEYPDFFTKLYALLDRDVMHVRYRPRFFRLLEVFMGSSHLPSALVAAFIKRLARLSLSAPPAAIVTVIPFIYNLLKLHPGCMTMIHRPNVDDVDSDPFDADEKDPIKTGASDSSLWELATLRTHYLASVSGLAKIFAEVMSKQSYAMEDFLDHSYSTMFETEATRKIRNAPAMAPVPQRQPIGTSFFPPTDAPAHEDGPVDLVSQLWTF
ncbi:hypothetical protein RQP46_001239 [Phenoliferia psychrophenolica]